MRHIEISADAVARLQGQLGSLRSGCGEDLTTPLLPRTPGVEKDVLRAEAAESLSAACMPTGCSTTLVGLELDKRKKLGTSSKCPGYCVPATQGDSLEDLIERYFQPRPPIIFDTRAWNLATEYVSSLVPVSRIGRLSLIPLERAAASEFPNAGGLGFPVFSSDFEKYGYEVYKLSEEIHNSSYALDWVPCFPAILGKRGQQRGPEKDVGPYAKTRVVYAMSRAIMNIEKRLQYPLQGFLRSREEFSAWVHRDRVALSLTRLFTRRPRSILSVDFSSFDVSVPEVVISEIFRIIEGWFVPESAHVIRFCKEAFTRCGIICPSRDRGACTEYPGDMRSGGVPSGSVLTNLIDSLVNLWVASYAASLAGSSINFALVQGDDGVYVFRGNLPKEEFSKAVATIGMKVSVEKSMESDKCVHFLQDLHEADSFFSDGLNRGQRPFSHILNNACNHERNDGKPWSRIDEVVRWVQQWNEGRYHPGFQGASHWLYERDWMVRDVVERVHKGDTSWIPGSIQRIMRKDARLRFYYDYIGLSASSFAETPVFQHLLMRRR